MTFHYGTSFKKSSCSDPRLTYPGEGEVGVGGGRGEVSLSGPHTWSHHPEGAL